MYITNEALLGANGTLKEFTLANKYKAGSLLITYNGKLFYEFKENSASNQEDKLVFDFAPLATDTILISYYTITEPSVLNALRYTTVRQVKDNSRVADFATLSDVDIEKLIRESEGYIDVLAGSWARYYVIAGSNTQVGQMHTFPRIDDDVSDDSFAFSDYPPIPAEVSQATIYAVENLQLLGTPNSADIGEETIESEKLGDYNYKKTTKNTADDPIAMARLMIGNRATSLMRGFTKNYGEMTIDDGRATRPESWLNSRKRRALNL